MWLGWLELHQWCRVRRHLQTTKSLDSICKHVLIAILFSQVFSLIRTFHKELPMHEWYLLACRIAILVLSKGNINKLEICAKFFANNDTFFVLHIIETINTQSNVIRELCLHLDNATCFGLANGSSFFAVIQPCHGTRICPLKTVNVLHHVNWQRWNFGLFDDDGRSIFIQRTFDTLVDSITDINHWHVEGERVNNDILVGERNTLGAGWKEVVGVLLRAFKVKRDHLRCWKQIDLSKMCHKH